MYSPNQLHDCKLWLTLCPLCFACQLQLWHKHHCTIYLHGALYLSYCIALTCKNTILSRAYHKHSHNLSALSLGHKYPCERRTNNFWPLRKWSKIVRTAFVRVFVTKALTDYNHTFKWTSCLLTDIDFQLRVIEIIWLSWGFSTVGSNLLYNALTMLFRSRTIEPSIGIKGGKYSI